MLLQVREIREKSGKKIGQGKVREFENLVWENVLFHVKVSFCRLSFANAIRARRSSIREKLKFGQGKVRENDLLANL